MIGVILVPLSLTLNIFHTFFKHLFEHVNACWMSIFIFGEWKLQIHQTLFVWPYSSCPSNRYQDNILSPVPLLRSIWICMIFQFSCYGFNADTGHCYLNNDNATIDDTMLFNIFYLELTLLVIYKVYQGLSRISSLSRITRIIFKC